MSAKRKLFGFSKAFGLLTALIDSVIASAAIIYDCEELANWLFPNKSPGKLLIR